jgi:uncharacterized membrane protein YfcA
VVTAAVVALPVAIVAVRACGVALNDVVRAIRRPVLSALVGASAGLVVTLPLPDDLSVVVVGATVVSLGCVAVLRPWQFLPVDQPTPEVSRWS